MFVVYAKFTASFDLCDEVDLLFIKVIEFAGLSSGNAVPCVTEFRSLSLVV